MLVKRIEIYKGHFFQHEKEPVYKSNHQVLLHTSTNTHLIKYKKMKKEKEKKKNTNVFRSRTNKNNSTYLMTTVFWNELTNLKTQKNLTKLTTL